MPNVVIVTWTSPEDGDGFVEYGLDGNLDQATPVETTGSKHRVVVLGLKEGRTYSMRAVTRTPTARAW